MKNKNHGGSRPGAGRRAKYGERLIQKRVPESGIFELETTLERLAETVDRSDGTNTPSVRYSLELPLLRGSIPAGLPEMPSGMIEEFIDLNDIIGAHTGADFLVKVSGESMIDAGILPGDLLSVRSVVDAPSGSIVIAELDGGLTVKRLLVEGRELKLCSENSKQTRFSDQVFSGGRIRGLVVGLVRKF